MHTRVEPGLAGDKADLPAFRRRAIMRRDLCRLGGGELVRVRGSYPTTCVVYAWACACPFDLCR